jgi:hypothetical protein
VRTKDKLLLGLVVLVAAIISWLIASAVFNSPAKRKDKVPIVQKIESTFPDVKNDSDYNSFLNSKALDPTQPVQIGNTKNSAPFNSGP